MPKETFRSEWVKCGKPGCGSCPHGPYWYAYWREGKKTRKRYIGKERPPVPPETAAARPDPLDDIFDRRKASADLAWRILGIPRTADRKAALARYREQSRLLHPDRCSGETKPMMRLNCAWAYLKAVFGW
jgi:hypothetical protein